MQRNTGMRKAAAIIGLAVVLGMTGCAGNEEQPEETQEDISIQDGLPEEAGEPGEENTKEEAGDSKSEALEQNDAGGDTEESGEENASNSMAARETEYLGGKVQDVRTDGMTFAQTTLLDEDGMVTLLSVEDAKKISVQFTADTKVERWTIQGGGADIDMREADVADLEPGMGVELEGYFAGETFVATRIIIEEG